MAATATLDPALAIRAAVRNLYDDLKQIVDRGPTDDPRLLDELRALTRRDGGRITRAMKKLVAAESPSPAPTKPASTQPDRKPAPAGTSPAAKQTTVAPTATPASKPAVGGRATVRLPQSTSVPPASRTPRPTRPTPSASMLSAPAPRSTPATWVWPVLLLAAVLGVLEGLYGSGWIVAGVVLAAATALVALFPSRSTRFLSRKIRR